MCQGKENTMLHLTLYYLPSLTFFMNYPQVEINCAILFVLALRGNFRRNICNCCRKMFVNYLIVKTTGSTSQTKWLVEEQSLISHFPVVEFAAAQRRSGVLSTTPSSQLVNLGVFPLWNQTWLSPCVWARPIQ